MNGCYLPRMVFRESKEGEDRLGAPFLTDGQSVACPHCDNKSRILKRVIGS